MAFSLAAGTFTLLQVGVLFVFNLAALRELLALFTWQAHANSKLFFHHTQISKAMNHLVVNALLSSHWRGKTHLIKYNHMGVRSD